MSEPGMRFVMSNGVSYYRLALPVEFMANRFDFGGTWSALLTIGKPRLERSDSRDGTDQTILGATQNRPALSSVAPARGAAAQRAAVLAAEQFPATAASVNPQGGDIRALRSVPYSVVVHAYSNLSLQAHVEQQSFEPGARVTLHASLAQSGIPLTTHAQVWAEVTPPAGAGTTVVMPEESDGQFTAQFSATRPGVYRVRIRARGTTMGGEAFTREQTLTAAVWRGGNQVPTGPADGGGKSEIVDYLRDRDARLCELITCLLQPNGVLSAELEKRLRALGIDVDRVRKCLAGFCRGEHHGN
jgi:hypothetical protein